MVASWGGDDASTGPVPLLVRRRRGGRLQGREGAGPDRREGGAEARASIERFIARRIPPGHRHAFTGGELAELNRVRTSRHTFAPYPVSRVEPPATPRLVAAALRAF